MFRIGPEGAIEKLDWTPPREFVLETVVPDGKGGLFLVSPTKTLHRDAAGKITPFAETGSAAGAVAIAPDGALLLGRGDRVLRARRGAPAEIVADGLGEVFGVALGPKGEIYATDWEGGRVWKLAGEEKTVAAKGLEYPSGVVCDPEGVLYVKESGRQTNKDMRLRKIPPKGEMTVLATVPSISRWRSK